MKKKQKYSNFCCHISFNINIFFLKKLCKTSGGCNNIVLKTKQEILVARIREPRQNTYFSKIPFVMIHAYGIKFFINVSC